MPIGHPDAPPEGTTGVEGKVGVEGTVGVEGNVGVEGTTEPMKPVDPVDELPTPLSNGVEPKMLGGVPTIGAAPLEGVPTLPMGLPGVAEIDGGVPTVGAPPRGTEAWPKAPIGGDNSTAASKGTASVRCNMGSPVLYGPGCARAVPAPQE